MRRQSVPSTLQSLVCLLVGSLEYKKAPQHRLLISYRDQDTTIPLKREQFETLYQRISDSPQAFDLDRLPADAEPYATILSVHPRFEIDQREGVLKNTDTPTPSSLVDAPLTVESQDHEPARKEPDLPLYSDSLLLTRIRCS